MLRLICNWRNLIKPIKCFRLPFSRPGEMFSGNYFLSQTRWNIFCIFPPGGIRERDHSSVTGCFVGSGSHDLTNYRDINAHTQVLKRFTVNFLNIWTPEKLLYYCPKIWTMWLYHRGMSPKDADWMANSVDPDQTAPLGVWSGSALFAQAI